MTNRKGFTVVEIIIAAGVLALFMTGLFSLYRGGSNLSNATIWAQQTINQLKMSCRQLNDSIKASTYPTSITFPGNIAENTSDDFGLNYYEGTMFATETVGISGTGYNGAKVLYLTESTPAKTGFAADDNTDAEIIYHIFALTENGNLNYSKWQEDIAGNDVETLSRPNIPPGSANQISRRVLARDVESISCQPTSPASPRSPLKIQIVCKIPRGNTTRSETAIGTPNVALIARNTIGGW